MIMYSCTLVVCILFSSMHTTHRISEIKEEAFEKTDD